MSVRMALAKLSACAAGCAVVGGGAVHVAETPAAQGQYRKVKQVKAEADKLSAGWEGVADAEFLAQIDSCMARLQHTPLMMNEISIAVKTASDLIQKAEEEARAQIAATIVDDGN